MHLTPTELRTLRHGSIVIRFALLDSMAFVLVELPASGSSGTSIETPCVKPHWGFVIEGEVAFEVDGRRQVVAPGSAFHVAGGGRPHRFLAEGAARIAGFEPVDPVVDTSDAALAAAGLEPMRADTLGAATVIPASIVPPPDPKRIESRTWSMGDLVLTEARFGAQSGYSSNWCDAPHWGLVTSGKLAMEWENDLEILSAGDVFHCPAGPPGHRAEAADPASLIDLTPVAALTRGRVAFWRTAPKQPSRHEPIAVAGLG